MNEFLTMVGIAFLLGLLIFHPIEFFSVLMILIAILIIYKIADMTVKAIIFFLYYGLYYPLSYFFTYLKGKIDAR